MCAPEYREAKKAALEAMRHNPDYDRMLMCARCAISEIETKFRVLNEEYSLAYSRNPIKKVRTRLKKDDSIAEKIAIKGLEPVFPDILEDVNDIAGVRVVCSHPTDIYVLENLLLSQDDVTLLRRKDYVAKPKDNGYRGLHLIVEIPIFLQKGKEMFTVEVQLRTMLMDCWASVDHDLQYKKDLDPVLKEEIQDDLKGCAEIAESLEQHLQAVMEKLSVKQERDLTASLRDNSHGDGEDE